MFKLEIIRSEDNEIVSEGYVGVQDDSGNFHGEFLTMKEAGEYIESETQLQIELENSIKKLHNLQDVRLKPSIVTVLI